jgi:nitroreductase
MYINALAGIGSGVPVACRFTGCSTGGLGCGRFHACRDGAGLGSRSKIALIREASDQRDEAIRSATFGASGLIHAAQAMGLGTTPMIGFDPVGVSREFSLSDNEAPARLVAVGYPTEANWPHKPRRPTSDVLAFA